MTEDQVKRAAFLITARKELRGELEALPDKWEGKNLKPFCLMEDGDFACWKDSADADAGDLRVVVTLDKGLAIKAVLFLIATINGELNELGVTECQ